ncbi:hypothetical protein J7E25_14305 [Agromyces sp. ISL-38]|uniref:hypothetical protein n=1 Tax=Agromyces sp. ISL-38 TaxID=2819107 RepID=UPI001BEC8A9A|nr:hypothetical protein [Agromyces sp. ISL-38]MBT2500263.1 hypothetical protein [Agromyces sp. ISL-38]
MRWDLLFDDLESQLDQEQRDEERALAIEEERLRLGRLTLRDRLSAIASADGDDRHDPTASVRVELQGGRILALRPLAFGRDWMSAELREPGRGGAQCIVPLGAIAALLPTRAQLDPSLEPLPESSARLAERIGLPFVLRDLCRRRTHVQLTTVDGVSHGTIDRVARDHIDLALHDADAPRREREVQGYRVVPLARVLLVAFR